MKQKEKLTCVKEDTPLTLEEKKILAKKTGYGIGTIDQIIRGYRPANARHTTLITLYRKMVHLKELHRENYLKDLENL